MNNFESYVQASHDAQLADKQEYERLNKKDCDFCTNDEPPERYIPREFLLVSNSLSYFAPGLGLACIEIKYCPMCGRKLYDKR